MRKSKALDLLIGKGARVQEVDLEEGETIEEDAVEMPRVNSEIFSINRKITMKPKKGRKTVKKRRTPLVSNPASP